MLRTLKLTAAKLVLGTQPSEDLPDVATELLDRGVDSPSLRVLAGSSSSDVREARDLFIRGLDELGIAVPDEQASLWMVTKHLLEQVVTGDIGAYEGASRISDSADSEGDLRVFAHLESEWGDHPPGLRLAEVVEARRAAIEADIRQAALDVLNRGQLRRWVKLEARPGSPPVTDIRTGRPIELEDLPITRSLRTSVQAWARESDHFNASSGAPPGGFSTRRRTAMFVERGEHLARALQEDLGEDWHVEYHPMPGGHA